MGGLARRVSYTQAFRKAFADIPVLELSVGGVFNDQGVTATPPFRDVVVQNDFALRGYSRFAFDALNVTYQDLRVIHPYLKLDQAKAPDEFSVLKTLVSANLTAATDKKTHRAVSPYVIRELSSARFPKGKLRVGVTGVSEQAPSDGTGYVWRDPKKALQEVLPELRKKSDLVIVLAYLPVEDAKKLAAETPEADAFVVGYTQPFALPIEAVDKVQVVVNNYETKFMGDLRVHFGKDGEKSYTNRFIALDTLIPDEPEAAKLASEAKQAIDAARRAPLQVQTPPQR